MADFRDNGADSRFALKHLVALYFSVGEVAAKAFNLRIKLSHDPIAADNVE